VCGKLGALAPGPAALLPRTGPSSNGMNGLYGHGFYGNGTVTATALRQRIRNAGNQALRAKKKTQCACASTSKTGNHIAQAAMTPSVT